MKIITRYSFLRILIFFIFIVVLSLLSLSFLTKMPGKSHSGVFPPLTVYEKELSPWLHKVVFVLSEKIGERNYLLPDRLNESAVFIEEAFREAGLPVKRHSYNAEDKKYHNIVAEKKGAQQPDKIIIIGAHYDSVVGSPGANDNTSGIAVLLALSRAFADKTTSITIRFVAFVNEEPPFFFSKKMGSYAYARTCKDLNENIIAMISLETVGYFSEKKGSQRYPFPLGFFYPDQGNFIAFVSNLSSKKLLYQIISRFRYHAALPSEGAALPWFIPGVFWSDHWPFWKMGYRAIMVTDTALFRYPYYHSPYDTPDKLDYERMARLVAGLESTINDLAEAQQ
jgi:Zn-dependent M28 family amino/carboxypeptidase